MRMGISVNILSWGLCFEEGKLEVERKEVRQATTSKGGAKCTKGG